MEYNTDGTLGTLDTERFYKLIDMNLWFFRNILRFLAVDINTPGESEVLCKKRIVRNQQLSSAH